MSDQGPTVGHVLVVEDDPAVGRAVAASLGAAGCRVELARTGGEGLERAAADPPGVIVLDLLLPDLSGFDFCRRLREWSSVPVIVLSGVDGEDDKVAALDAGADDYVTKPFRVGELLARVRAAARRGAPSSEESAIVRFAEVELDLARQSVRKGGQPVRLTPTEYRVLSALARKPDAIVTHRELAGAVWGSRGGGHNHRLRVHVAALRRKLEDDPGLPRHLITEAGVGYRLSLEPW